MNKKYKILAVLAVIVIICVVTFIGHSIPRASATATTFNVWPPIYNGTNTPPYFSHLKAGVSTTTTTSLDSYVSGTNKALDNGTASLLLTLTATSTPPVLKWRFEFSQDGVDWYPESVELVANATTTVVVRDFKEYSWAFASSTAGSFSDSKALKLISVPTPTRFVRTVFYLATGSPNAALHYRYVSKTQL